MNGGWIGLLSDAQLRGVDERYYDDTTVYRTAEWNEQGLFPWEQDMVARHLSPGGRIAVIGCGGGREVLALRENGYEAIGYESHPALAEYGQQLLTSHGHPSCILSVPRDTFPTADGWTGVVLGWGVYSLIGGRERRVTLLRSAGQHMIADGRVLLSFLHRRCDDRELRWTAAIANGLRAIRRAPRVDVGDTLRPNLIHFFSRGQIDEEAVAAGCQVVEHRVTNEIEPGVAYASAVLETRS